MLLTYNCRRLHSKTQTQTAIKSAKVSPRSLKCFVNCVCSNNEVQYPTRDAWILSSLTSAQVQPLSQREDQFSSISQPVLPDDDVNVVAAGDWSPRSRARWRHDRCAGSTSCHVDGCADADRRRVTVCSRRCNLPAHLLQKHQTHVGTSPQLQGCWRSQERWRRIKIQVHASVLSTKVTLSALQRRKGVTARGTK